MINSLTALPPQQDLYLSDKDNDNATMEALLYSYLHQDQQFSSPATASALSMTPSTTLSSPSATGLHSDYNYSSNTALYNNNSLPLSDDLFQSPQLSFQHQQQLYPPLPLQPTSLSSNSWNPILEMLQATATFDPTIPNDMDNNSKIHFQINSYTDLLNALESIQVDPHNNNNQQQQQQQRKKRPDKRRKHHYDISTCFTTQQQQEQQAAESYLTLPGVVRDTVESTSFLATLMEKAQRHWCCVGFKVAPVTLDIIRYWRQAPVTIIYCVASIVLVTFMDHNAGQAYVKSAAMEFYSQARRKMDDIVFDDENDPSNYDDDSLEHRQKAMTIQSYFCLSYTSNLLRLYEQQRTWGGLASIALQLRTRDTEKGCRPMDQAILLCWCRWYYVDAWMSLTLHRECLLPDTPPRFILDIIQQYSTSSIDNNNMNGPLVSHEHQSLYQFAILTKFMRRYIKIIQAGKLMDPVTMNPSPDYYRITDELKQWYNLIQQQSTPPDEIDGPDSNVHLHLCYHAMCLVIIYRFLHPDIRVPNDTILMDGLETNLALLQSLQQLSSQGCDQSTYHHMFFAIHNTASRIYQYHTKHRSSKWQQWAKQQLQMNLVLLKGTPAYANDVFQMRLYAEKIEQQFVHMGLELSGYYQSTLKAMEQWILQQQHQQLLLTTLDDQEEESSPSPFVSALVAALKQPTARIPGIHVYKLQTAATIKKPRKSANRVTTTK
ncbi:hypothetical protein BC941DRAFT_434648 [Chlamydoabsidia padenii]|nr:hypothetical protein BC941DRAFT_434648 [Chlamydoabsidia padenii]